jgi:hypothetical protein
LWEQRGHENEETVVPQAFSRSVALAGLVGVALVPAPGMAAQRSSVALPDLSAVHLVAHHRHHHGHVGPRNHPRGDIGDAEVERLNEGQLDRNYRGPDSPSSAAPGYAPSPGYYAPPPAGYAPAPGYAPLPNYAPALGNAVMPGRPAPMPGSQPPLAPGYRGAGY